MKYILLFMFSFLPVSLNAQEITQEEFPLIKPISLEKAGLSLKNYFADIDADGVSDDKDKCLNTPQNTKVDLFGCMILDDSDKDGVSDKDDECPNTQEGATVNLSGCEPDNDNDGVPDARDNCPDTSEEFLVDTAGCPQTAILNIHFQSKEFKIMDDSLAQIENFALFLLENKDYQALIYGYTDTLESDNNQKLSRQRAHVVVDALIGQGVKLTRLTAIGMGSKKPIADNNTAEGRAKNRRIEVELLQ